MSKAVFTRSEDGKTLIVTRVFEAPRDLVWKCYTDGDILAKWWGPEGWPCTTVEFDFREGGHWLYYMQGPDGTKAWGRNDYLKIEKPRMVRALDSFCDEHGAPNVSLPRAEWETVLEEVEGGTRMVVHSTYPESKDLDAVMAMGMQEGFTSSLDNLAKVLAESK